MAARWTVSENHEDGHKEVFYRAMDGEVRSCGRVDPTTPRPMIDAWIMERATPGDLMVLLGRTYFKMMPAQA